MASGSLTKIVNRAGRASWRVRVELPALAGKRRWRTGTFATKREAELMRARWLADAGDAVPSASSLRLETFLLEHWLPDYRQHHRASSYAKREQVCRVHLIPSLGHVRLDRLTPLLIQQVYAPLVASHQANTVRGIGATLNAALNTAVQWELLPRNPARGVRLPAPVHREPVLWNPESVRAFLLSEQDTTWRAFWLVLLLTGMRKGEALALRWQDFDAASGTITVTRTLTKDGIGPVKTARGHRVLALPAQLCQHLANLYAAQVPELAIIFDFPVTAVDWRWERNLRKAGLRHSRIHDLRHQNVTVGLAAGVPMKVLSERVGHANVGITSDLYAHVTRSLDARVAEIIARHLLGDEETEA